MWKNRIAWLLILAAALCVYLLENNAGTRILLVSAVLLPLCSAAALFLPRPRLSARLEIPGTLARGTAASCALLLRNDAALPSSSVCCTLEIRNLLTGGQFELPVTSAVGAKQTETVAFSVEAAHCGKLVIQMTDLRMLDSFGLFARRLPHQAYETALVPPVVSPVELSLADAADFLTDSQRYSVQMPGCDPSETFRIREYVPGDPVRQLHWKLSLKTDTMLVRDFGLPVADKMLLLLETTALACAPVTPEDMDGMLDLLFSISTALLSLDLPHTVGWQDHTSGRYESRELHSTDDLSELQALILSNRIGLGETTVAGCYGRDHIQCAYAHAAVIAPYPEPDISLLCHGNRVSALLLREDASRLGLWESGVSVIPVSVTALRQGDLHLTL